VRAQKVRDPKLLQLVARPVQLLIARCEQVQAADDSIHWLVGKSLFRVSQNIDDPGVPAAGQHYQASRRVEHERLILRNVVFD